MGGDANYRGDRANLVIGLKHDRGSRREHMPWIALTANTEHGRAAIWQRTVSQPMDDCFPAGERPRRLKGGGRTNEHVVVGQIRLGGPIRPARLLTADLVDETTHVITDSRCDRAETINPCAGKRRNTEKRLSPWGVRERHRELCRLAPADSNARLGFEQIPIVVQCGKHSARNPRLPQPSNLSVSLVAQQSRAGRVRWPFHRVSVEIYSTIDRHCVFDATSPSIVRCTSKSTTNRFGSPLSVDECLGN